MLTFFSFFSLLIYLVPIVLIVWFALRFLAIQERRNEILQSIADRMDK